MTTTQPGSTPTAADAADNNTVAHASPITFPAVDGATLVGLLHLPAGPAPSAGWPAVVMAGPWTQVEQQTARAYAARLAERGFAAVSFDFRYWGASDGSPRFRESTDKIDDLRATVSFLEEHPSVDSRRIAAYGVCFGAGYVLAAAARDDRIGAVITTAAWIHDRPSLDALFGEQEIERRLSAAREATAAWEQRGEVVTVPAWADGSNPEAGMNFPGGYYSTPERGAIPEWPNQLAVMSWTEWINFDAVSIATDVAVPTLYVHSDGSALPDNVRRAQASQGERASVFWTDGMHFDFYDLDPYVTLAVDVAAAFLRAKL